MSHNGMRDICPICGDLIVFTKSMSPCWVHLISRKPLCIKSKKGEVTEK